MGKMRWKRHFILHHVKLPCLIVSPWKCDGTCMINDFISWEIRNERVMEALMLLPPKPPSCLCSPPPPPTQCFTILPNSLGSQPHYVPQRQSLSVRSAETDITHSVLRVPAVCIQQLHHSCPSDHCKQCPRPYLSKPPPFLPSHFAHHWA